MLRHFAKKQVWKQCLAWRCKYGGPLAYEAASECDFVDGLLCWCLWDFSDKEFMLKETSTGKWTYALIPILKILSKIFGKLRLKPITLYLMTH